jgi:hypothetical protein
MEVIVRDSGIEIIANRQQIDNRFPVLGFTVKTGGLPYFEVIVTTEKRLFAPAAAAERTPGNFFSSRQANNQLQKTDGNDSVYIVPASVLSAFAQASPKPSAIYFTLIAYQDETGSSPQFAHPVDSLATSAPSVTIDAGFTGKTLSVVLSIPEGSCRRVEHGAMNLTHSPSHEYAQSLAEPDEGEAEDGYSLLNKSGHSMSFGLADEDTMYPEDGYEFNQRRESAGQSYEERSLDTYYENRDDGYQDGLEDELGYVAGTYANMQESSFPAGSSEPDELYDEDSARYGEGSAFEDSYSAPQSSARSDDPRYEYAGASAGYSTNGSSHYATAHSAPDHYDADEEFFRSQSDDFEEDYGDSFSYGGVSRAADTGEDGTSIAAARRIKARKKIVESVAKFESGTTGNPYKAINADTEFSSITWHEAYKKYHIGLSYGIVQFTQDGGSLGTLLTMMRDRDKAVFDKTFGGAKLADELINVTTATGPISRDTKGGRSVRVQPVDGKDIWLSPWKERFEAAGDHTPFQAAQNELANSEFLEKILEFCNFLGLDTDRAIAMVYDRAVNMGVGGGKKWVIGAVGPISTNALQQLALKALGKKDLKEFQKGAGLKVDGDWGPMSHAAMVSALRALGSTSPIPIPTREQMMDSMVRAAAGKKWEHRVVGLHDSGEFSDSAFPF